MKNKLEKILKIDLQFFAEEGEGDNNQNEDQASNNSEGDEDNNTVDEKKEYTTKELQRIMTREKKQGKSAGKNELLKELGIDNLDDFKTKLKEFNDYQEKKKTDLDKANDNVTKITNEKTAAEKRAILAEAKVEAMKNGVNPEFVDDVIVLALSKQQEGEDLSDVIEGMKETHKMFFGSKQNDDGTGNNPTGKKGAGKVEGLGTKLGKQRNGQAKKQSSYFKN